VILGLSSHRPSFIKDSSRASTKTRRRLIVFDNAASEAWATELVKLLRA